MDTDCMIEVYVSLSLFQGKHSTDSRHAKNESGTAAAVATTGRLVDSKTFLFKNISEFMWSEFPSLKCSVVKLKVVQF